MASQLTLQEREIISQMRYAGEKQAAIARRLGRHPSTISRELQRNSSPDGYYACVAQSRAKTRRQVHGWRRRKLLQPENQAYVRKRLNRFWSPEQIAGRSQRDFRAERSRRLSRQTIYNWIHKQRGEERRQLVRLLRRGGKKRRRPPQGRPPMQQIANRPQIINSRRRYGDWEGDTVVGRKQRGALVTIVERKSGYLLAGKIDSRHAAIVRSSIARQYRSIPARLRKSLTLDNGTEFSESDRLTEELSLDVYFADPYCSWQRGTNENTNGLLRQYFPKGTDFTKVPAEAVARAKQSLNNRPRKRLGYRTPAEVLKPYLQNCD